MKAFVAGIQDLSTIDYPGKISAVVFLAGCNFRCRYCFNSELLESKEEFLRDIKEIIESIEKNLPILDAVVFSGGEPLLQEKALVEISNWAQRGGLSMGMETNGTRPQTLEKMLNLELLDFIAVDIKAAFGRYGEVTQVEDDVAEKITESVEIIRNSGIEREFRTTFVPGLVGVDDIESISRVVGQDKWVWQRFRYDLGVILDKQLLGRDFSGAEMKRFKYMSKQYRNVILRF